MQHAHETAPGNGGGKTNMTNEHMAKRQFDELENFRGGGKFTVSSTVQERTRLPNVQVKPSDPSLNTWNIRPTPHRTWRGMAGFWFSSNKPGRAFRW